MWEALAAFFRLAGIVIQSEQPSQPKDHLTGAGVAEAEREAEAELDKKFGPEEK